MKTSKISIKPPCPELRGSLAGMKYPAFVEIKSDGEFCFIHVEPGNTFTVNKYGTIRQNFNELDRLLSICLKYPERRNGHLSVTFLGELCINNGKAGELYTLLSNKTNDDLQLYIFDILELNHQDLRDEELISRKEVLSDLLKGHKFIGHVHVADDESAVTKMFDKAVDAGYEGIVVKPLTGKLLLSACDWVKIKAKDQTDYKVTMIDKTLERLEFFSPVPQGHPNYPGVTVGLKCANKYKQFIKVGDFCTVEHQGVLPTGSLRHPVLIPNPNWK